MKTDTKELAKGLQMTADLFIGANTSEIRKALTLAADRLEELERELNAKDAHADEIYKAAVDLAKKLEDDLEKERKLADRLAHWLSSFEGEGLVPPEWDASAANALAAWKEGRRDS
jgi:Skp family chaperone for outer membrane proteins